MNRNLVVGAALAAAALAACSSGDINIDPATTVTDSNNTTQTGGGGANDVCAYYVTSGGQKKQGTYDGTNCTYAPSFVDAGNNLMYDLTIPALPNGGAHIFEGSLFVGETHRTQAELAAAGITKGGDGPKLTIEAGATLAFTSEKQYIAINRGSQIFAVGTPDAPITFTSLSDVQGNVGPEDVQQWGGFVIDGFGVTNKCAYTGSVAGGDLALAGECSVVMEGLAGLDENEYGGDNNDDSSGRLEYVVVKYTGAEVAPGSELNGIGWGAVGRNTVVKNIEMYSVYDDGMEFFGGAVPIENYVAVYARDDSIDIDEGYSGTITNSLVIQSATNGNNCIESDGIGDYGNLSQAARDNIIAQGINSRPTINNLTCIISVVGKPPATHDPSAGWHFREGIYPTINDSMVIGSFAANDQTSSTDNYCLKISDPETQQAAIDGNLVLNHVIFACAEKTAGQTFSGTTDPTMTEESFATGAGAQFATIPDGTAVNPTPNADTQLQLLEGTQPVYSIDWATSLVDGATPIATTDPDPRTFLGALSMGQTDWTQPWAFGIDPSNRAEPLWIEQ
jgi:hypothetical protein